MLARKTRQVLYDAISAQRIQKEKDPIPFDEPWYEEAPNYFKKAPVEPKGNLAKLVTGWAQTVRVNNPYRYANRDENSYLKNPQPNWGVYKGLEIGGDNVKHMGIGRAVYRAAGIQKGTEGLEWLMDQNCQIYYHFPNHMHRVPKSLPFEEQRGRWVLQSEKASAGKNPMDGMNQGYQGGRRRKMAWFDSMEAAVNYAYYMGWNFDVVLPKFRYHTRKSYSDNFKYRPPKN
ncbi:unnamed protein product [Blepharisma stoltei]|uniref:NADH dehydrogenase [ubiquinone] iron-sulfur protein 4, mitochondrial n=1 Tax=Blepharisma stoltei TaxID=1481888 RepID=A0AAU9J6C4_9CILI|nr:unnamed protein product [Blepharisma stoltei]